MNSLLRTHVFNAVTYDLFFEGKNRDVRLQRRKLQEFPRDVANARISGPARGGFAPAAARRAHLPLGHEFSERGRASGHGVSSASGTCFDCR